MGFFDGDWTVRRTLQVKGKCLTISGSDGLRLATAGKTFQFTPYGASGQTVSLTTIDETAFEGGNSTYEVKGKAVPGAANPKVFVGSVKETDAAGTVVSIESYVAWSGAPPASFDGIWQIAKIQPHGAAPVHKGETNITIANGKLTFRKAIDELDQILNVQVVGDSFQALDAPVNPSYRAQGRMILAGSLFLGLLGKGNPPGGAAEGGPIGDDNTESFVAVKVG